MGKETTTLNDSPEQSSEFWLSQARRVPSVNYNLRPQGAEISLLVIHGISLPRGVYGGDYIEQLFTNCLDFSAFPEFEDLRSVEVSSHILIDRLGRLTQFVPFEKRAWHAGVSHFNGCDNCNDFSIGIELEGVDDSPYTKQQYLALADTAAQLMVRYKTITMDNIVGHCDIAPGRKTDPGGAFNWSYFRQLLQAKVTL